MSDETVVPKLSALEKAGWRLPRPWELFYASLVVSTALLAINAFAALTLAWKICSAIVAIAGLIGIPVGVAHKSPREQAILAKSDIASAQALGEDPPAKALAIVADAAGKPAADPVKS